MNIDTACELPMDGIATLHEASGQWQLPKRSRQDVLSYPQDWRLGEQQLMSRLAELEGRLQQFEMERRLTVGRLSESLRAEQARVRELEAKLVSMGYPGALSEHRGANGLEAMDMEARAPVQYSERDLSNYEQRQNQESKDAFDAIAELRRIRAQMDDMYLPIQRLD